MLALFMRMGNARGITCNAVTSLDAFAFLMLLTELFKKV